jgi:hypothetical protein
MKPLVTRLLTQEENAFVYARHMRNDFPHAELKPLDLCIRQMQKGIYLCYGCFLGQELIAYACLVCAQNIPCMMLDYYAVVARHRSSGHGSKFLGQLSQMLHTCGILIEVESPRGAMDHEELTTRKRRIRFYEKNHARMTKVSGTVFFVAYDVMYPPIQKDIADEKVLSSINTLYRQMLPEELFTQRVCYQLT